MWVYGVMDTSKSYGCGWQPLFEMHAHYTKLKHYLTFCPHFRYLTRKQTIAPYNILHKQ